MHILFDYIHIILNINLYLPLIFQQYGIWVYAVVALIIFLESGFILTPFLPGESMLFALGAVAAANSLSINAIVLLLISAAIIGGFFNYAVGYFCENVVLKYQIQFVQRYIQQTEKFYLKYGSVAVLLARLIPIIRTFVPFFAGVARMRFSLFSLFNILGGIIWISIFCYLGYFFGALPIVKQHFSWIVLAIIIFSVIPVGCELIKFLRTKNHASNI